MTTEGIFEGAAACKPPKVAKVKYLTVSKNKEKSISERKVKLSFQSPTLSDQNDEKHGVEFQDGNQR